MFQVPAAKKLFAKFTSYSLADWCDKLNYAVSPIVLLTYAITLSGKQLIGKPMVCWPAAQWRSEWGTYAEQRCFSQFVYYHPMGRFKPLPIEGDMARTEVTFFRWAAAVAFVQALLFYLPNWLWKQLNHQSRFDWDGLVHRAKGLRKLDEKAEKYRQQGNDEKEGSKRDERRRRFTVLVKDIGEELEIEKAQREPKQFLGFWLRGWLATAYQLLSYISIKALYLLNIVGQLYVLNGLIAVGGEHYLTSTLNRLTGGRWLGKSNRFPLFPMTVWCRFTTGERAGNLNALEQHDIMCDIVSNLWNLFFYSGFFIWCAFLIVTMLWSMLWLILKVVPSARYTWISQLLDDGSNSTPPAQQIRDFADNGLGLNGILLLRFVEQDAGAEWAKDVCRALFKKYKPQGGVGNRLLIAV